MTSNVLTKICAFALTGLLLAGCTKNKKDNQVTAVTAEDEKAYTQSIAQWQQEREASLKTADGWLTLAGLFWLEEGDNTFGSSKENDLVFPDGKIPAQAGVITLSGGKVSTTIAKGVEVKSGGQPVQQAILYTPDQDTVPQLTHGSLTWFAIKRGDKYGIRLRDAQNEALTNVAGTKPKYKIYSITFVSIMGLIIPVLRELKEMLYLFENTILLNDDKLRHVLPDLTQTPMQQAMKETLAWFRKN